LSYATAGSWPWYPWHLGFSRVHYVAGLMVLCGSRCRLCHAAARVWTPHSHTHRTYIRNDQPARLPLPTPNLCVIIRIPLNSAVMHLQLQLAVVLLTQSISTLASPFGGPAPTPSVAQEATDGQGWTPRMTAAPILHGLQRRADVLTAFLAPNSVCGYSQSDSKRDRACGRLIEHS
jgi:hypothetical protein